MIRDLTGWDVQRRVRQHDGDSDLVGVPGWSIEVKNCQKALQGDISRWWGQCITQAAEARPALIYRAQRGVWRVRWPLGVVAAVDGGRWHDIDWTADTTIEAWVAVARELAHAG